MPKNKKHNLELSRFFGSSLWMAAAGVIAVAILVVIGTFTEIPLWAAAVVVFVLLMLAYVLILRFADRRGPHGADSQLLSPVLGNIMLDTVMKLSSPVFICDEKEERIIWYNRSFSAACDTNVQLYGHRAEEFLSCRVADLIRDNAGGGVPVMIGDNSFRAGASRIRAKDKVFLLVTMEDVTETERLYTQIAQSEAVVAYIMVDNLDELLQYEQEKFRTVAVQIESVLREWAEQSEGILKEYERDRYLFVFEAHHLDDFIVRKFDILDKIRDIRVGDGKLPVTVSIGVSNVRGVFSEKERAAAAALDMALQRGGDHVVVK